MSDCIKKTHDIFVEHYGDPRQWSQEITDLYVAIRSHVTSVAEGYRCQGQKEEREECQRLVLTALEK